MAVHRRSSRTRNVLAVLVLAALTLITIDARSNGGGGLSRVRNGVSDVFSPLQRATHAVLRPIGDFLTGAADYGSLRAENQRLRQQILQDQNQAAIAQAEKAQAEQVLALQNLPFVGSIPTVICQIDDVGSSNFDNTLTVEKGTADGLAPGQPVVAGGGLVGIVQTAAKHSATILLLTDPQFRVGVSLPGGNIGSVQGAGRTQTLGVNVVTTQGANGSPKPPVVTTGSVLVTSGLNSEKFPKGLPVGRVVKVVQLPGEPEPEIQLEPMVNSAQLSYLEVLLWSPR